MVGTIRFDEVSILKKPDRLIRCHPIRDGSPQASHERGKRRQAIRDIASRYQRKSLVGLAEQFGDRLSEILRTLARHDGCASTAERFRRERARRALRTGLHLSRSHSGQRRVQPGRASRTGSEHVRAHERRPRLRKSGHPAQRQTPLPPSCAVSPARRTSASCPTCAPSQQKGSTASRTSARQHPRRHARLSAKVKVTQRSRSRNSA